MIYALGFSQDGKNLVVSFCNRRFRGYHLALWEIASGQQVHEYAGQAGVALAVAVSPNGRILASAHSDGRVRLWEMKSGAELGQLQGHQGPVRAVAFSADSRKLVTGGSDTTALLWDVSNIVR